MTTLQKNTLLFLGLLGFALVIDVIAVKTGFPYGYFWYGEGFGPAIFQVPVAFIFGFPVLYLGASAVANRAGVSPGIPFMLTVACITLAVALIVEPCAVAQGLWSYRNGGEYLGVPIGNLAGWLFVGSLAASLFPNKWRSEKAVAMLLLVVIGSTLLAILHGLIIPAIIGLLFALVVSWFDLRKHGWQSGNQV